MTSQEKLQKLQTLLEITDSSATTLLNAFLNSAEQAILNRAFPFRTPDTQPIMPPRYDDLQVLLAQRYYLRQGAEGETVHNENGINRTYASVNDEDLLSQVIQTVKVI